MFSSDLFYSNSCLNSYLNSYFPHALSSQPHLGHGARLTPSIAALSLQMATLTLSFDGRQPALQVHKQGPSIFSACIKSNQASLHLQQGLHQTCICTQPHCTVQSLAVPGLGRPTRCIGFLLPTFDCDFASRFASSCLSFVLIVSANAASPHPPLFDEPGNLARTMQPRVRQMQGERKRGELRETSRQASILCYFCHFRTCLLVSVVGRFPRLRSLSLS